MKVLHQPPGKFQIFPHVGVDLFGVMALVRKFGFPGGKLRGELLISFLRHLSLDIEFVGADQLFITRGHFLFDLHESVFGRALLLREYVDHNGFVEVHDFLSGLD
ncbi:MAG: hypothetical protein AAF998_01655 [Bacteroidota bacterium]